MGKVQKNLLRAEYGGWFGGGTVTSNVFFSGMELSKKSKTDRREA
jgi:hypothetical protein